MALAQRNPGLNFEPWHAAIVYDYSSVDSLGPGRELDMSQQHATYRGRDDDDKGHE